MVNSTATDLSKEVKEAAINFAKQKNILITTDYDGTLSGLRSNPMEALMPEKIKNDLRDLANLPDTKVAIISGRSREVLIELSGLSDPIELIGSHGSEFANGFRTPMTSEKKAKLQEIINYLNDCIATLPKSWLETKPASAVFHYRDTDLQAALPVIKKIKYHFQGEPDVYFTEGKMVLEYAVINASKGTAIQTLQAETQPDATMFMGDDLTDETGFAVLISPQDFSVKIGEKPTKAKFTIPNIDQVYQIFELILTTRRNHAN